MRELRFNVLGQNITKDKNCDFSGIVAGTEGYLFAKFSFSKEWDDGVVKTSGTNNKAYTQNTNNIVIGGALEDGVLSSGFKGTINDFRIYNRVLTESEITSYIS